jgi:hypothetical protein
MFYSSGPLLTFFLFPLLLIVSPLLVQLFFAKVPPTALASEVELLFGSFGKLAEVNLFRAWAGAKHSKVSAQTAPANISESKHTCRQHNQCRQVCL